MIEEEPSVFTDYSNPLLQHVAIFKSLLEKYKVSATESMQGMLKESKSPV